MKCAWNELLAILPPRMRTEVDRQGRSSLQELRLRRNQAVVLVHSGGKRALQHCVSAEDLQYVLTAACRYSPWTNTTASQGYFTAPGGHRIGMCGEAVIRDGVMSGITTITSLNIRVARDFVGISRNLGLRNGNFIVIGPPGSGKTTLLRDLIRQRSLGENVAVVDERREIFPSAANFETGPNTDVMCGCTKKHGIELLLRCMTPDCVAVDEITAEEDCFALIQAGWCGVSLMATAHAASISDLQTRPVYAPLMRSGLFNSVVVLAQDKTWRLERLTA